MSLNKPDDIKKRLRKKGFELDRDLIDGRDAYVLVNPENGRYVYTYSAGAHMAGKHSETGYYTP